MTLKSFGKSLPAGTLFRLMIFLGLMLFWTV